ncbi:MAG: transketolase [Candidatus Omnitrophica bacterium CG11_big_fil_rev_8_21_14_0_20_45_26]|uniref:Transketolase n=1 Tax=Candidatus Abzuiibacterium crystallinum TaxID=1974748 RepID=A0A2H0LQK4_9BACT|nr:MAG: transketolase [Candidatus Omnitrophica bacterium CG11_big_fil_rev_8_21_14_0_20_45_26]PIW65446.1 MAG: transketolase [Candidatus Omnitrophica bacterium CG12_big_fil_rev_8_21_14_0_65_45_16]
MGMATRDAYGKALVKLGETNSQVLVLDADLSKSTKSAGFQSKFPDRFIECGIAEANMAGIAAGLALSGFVPFINSFATFLMSKTYDQLRMSVAFPEVNVKAVGSHGGISVGEDGASQQSIEDFALAASLPNFSVISPCDEYSTEALVPQIAQSSGPVFMRTGRPKTPLVYDPKKPPHFEIGKGILLQDGQDVTIIANGLLVFEALSAADLLAEEGIKAAVIDMHTIKPLDEELVIAQAKKTNAVVSCEEHQIYGGLGSIVAKVLSEHCPTPIEFVAIQDTFAESGQPDELLEKYGLTAPHIQAAVKRVLKRKKK